MEACVVPARVCGFGKLALTERHEEKLQGAEKSWVLRICKINREIRKNMGQLREEITMKE